MLATNHVFDILVQAMGAGGNLDKIQEKTLPPRKRAGWAGGDDRGPSSKPASKQADQEAPPEGNTDPSTVDKSDPEIPKDGEVGGSAASSRGAPGGVTRTSAGGKTGQHNDSSDRDRDAEGGSAGEVGVRVGGERAAQADGMVAGGASESDTVVVKRAVEEGGDVGPSPRVDGTCKRGRTEMDGAGVHSTA